MSQILPETAKRRVGDVMTREVITVSAETRVSQIAQLMSTHNISGIPVIDAQNHLLGIVTELDMIVRNARFKLPSFFMILDSIIYLETPHHFHERLEHMLGTTAQEIMSESIVTISPTATIEELAELMVNRQMNPVPVVEAGRLIGIVSRSDIIRLMAQELDANSP